jgi:RNA recognition motif-containing protein
MGKKLFVGNLPFSATDESLQQIFSQAGSVASAKVIIDRDTGRSKGFGFVEMSTDAEAADGIAKFNGADYEGRAMTVSEARPQAPRTGGGGFGGERRSSRY